MATRSPQGITQLLERWSEGDEKALDQLMPLVYDELHRLAGAYLRRERGDHTLQPTALVNEAYLKLVRQRNIQWQNRAQFFGVAAQLMRRILVDFARSRLYQKRGGGAEQVSLDEALMVSREKGADLVALDDALTALAGVDPRMSQVVELRFFGGLDVKETAAVLQVSPETVHRDWRLAKEWLLHELS
jgi:RNA polymerase sigma factor (TIGR02999 family)